MTENRTRKNRLRDFDPLYATPLLFLVAAAALRCGLWLLPADAGPGATRLGDIAEILSLLFAAVGAAGVALAVIVFVVSFVERRIHVVKSRHEQREH